MSEGPCEPRYEKMIERAFVGDLPSDRWRELSAHLARCTDCRAYHDRLGVIDEAMSAGGALPPVVRDRILEQVIPEAPGRRLRLSTLLTYASAAAAVVVAAVILPFASVEPNDPFQPRGDGPTFAVRPPGVRLFCISPPVQEGGRARVEGTVQAARDPLPIPKLPCRLDQELQLAYATPRNRTLYMTVRGETEDGGDHWYAPREEGGPAVALDEDAESAALGWSTRLGVHHRPGKVRVVARFFEAPEAEAPLYEVYATLEVRKP